MQVKNDLKILEKELAAARTRAQKAEEKAKTHVEELEMRKAQDEAVHKTVQDKPRLRICRMDQLDGSLLCT